MQKELFVTGATGRLGRRFVDAAVEKSYEVTALVRSPAKASLLPEGVELFKGDLAASSVDALREGVRGKTVVHLAAIVNMKAPAGELWDVNVEGTRRIVDAAKFERVPRFVHMSSTSIYHNPPYMPINEKQRPTPSTGYGETKLEAEKIVKNSGLDYVILRSPAVYGPGFDEGFKQVSDLVKRRKMVVIGSGKNKIPLIHVDDLVQALLLAVENKRVHRDAFIVTSGEEHTQEETLRMLAKVLGVAPPKKHVPMPLAYGIVALDAFKGLFTGRRKLRRWHVDFLTEDRVFDTTKARRVLGFAPKVRLEEGIREAAASFQTAG